MTGFDIERIEIKQMEFRHLDEVFEIEKFSFATPWTRESIENEIKNNERAVYIVALDNGKVAGYAGLWHVVNEGHITNIAVDWEYRKRGVGAKMVSKFLEIAAEREMIGLTLEVRISNIAAQNLYAKFGFKPEGFRKEYYADTREDAIIMWKYL